MCSIAAGRIPEAHDAATQALDLYQRKGNLPGVRESRRCLSRYSPAVKGAKARPVVSGSPKAPPVS